MISHDSVSTQGQSIGARVKRFVRDVIIPFERDPRWTSHGPSLDLVAEMRALARNAGVMTPHMPAGRHLSHRDTALVLRAAASRRSAPWP